MNYSFFISTFPDLIENKEQDDVYIYMQDETDLNATNKNIITRRGKLRNHENINLAFQCRNVEDIYDTINNLFIGIYTGNLSYSDDNEQMFGYFQVPMSVNIYVNKNKKFNFEYFKRLYPDITINKFIML